MGGQVVGCQGLETEGPGPLRHQLPSLVELGDDLLPTGHVPTLTFPGKHGA